MNANTKRRKLRPAGHSAFIESLIQPAIVGASTLMSAIAAYVLAIDEITRALTAIGQQRMPSLLDLFVIALCAGMGLLIDMAIIVSATRYKMHKVRGDDHETPWLNLAKWVLIIGLISETMTLFYFFVHLNVASYPDWMVRLADLIHALLSGSRAVLPPIVIAYFAAGVMPVAFDRADRNREIKSRTSSNVMVLIDRLSEVEDTDDKAEMLQALGGQLMLATYAEYDETARTSEPEQIQRDAKLVTQLARMHGIDWSAIGADIAPELISGPIVDATVIPERPPTGPGTPVAARTARARRSQPRQRPQVLRLTPARLTGDEVERRARNAWEAAPMRVGKPRLSNTSLARKIGVAPATASKWTNILRREDEMRRAQQAQ